MNFLCRTMVFAALGAAGVWVVRAINRNALPARHPLETWEGEGGNLSPAEILPSAQQASSSH